MATAAAIVLAFFQSVPIADKWMSWLLKIYLQWRFAGMAQANIDAVHALITKKDQRDVEKLLGYSRAGEPSGVPGAVVVPALPGLPKLPNS